MNASKDIWESQRKHIDLQASLEIRYDYRFYVYVEIDRQQVDGCVSRQTDKQGSYTTQGATDN